MPKQAEQNYKNKDFTDYFLLFLNTGREHEFFPSFKKLVNDAKPIEDIYPELFQKEIILQEKIDEAEYETVNFYDAIHEKYINKPISFRAIVRGEAAKPYIYPVKVRITCEMTKGESCASCGLFLTGGKIEIKLDNINPLELIDCNSITKTNLIKRKVGIMQCGQFDIELVEQKYMQEIFLSPIAEDVNTNLSLEEIEKKEQRFITRHAFSEGSDVVPNKTYKFYSIPVPNPKNQGLVYYVKNAKEEQSNLDSFELSEKEIEELKIFCPDSSSEYNDIEIKLKHIYRDFSLNLSPIIIGRNDVMFACDLAFHSVLHFWLGESFERGWVEGLVVGDTSTGKTKASFKLIKHYRAGVMQGAGNSTIAGLIGGMDRFESINVMTWGLLPLNNSRLVMLDEMSDIRREVFSELTRVRSEGIAERTIVGGSSSTSAKVRLIWLSNPRKRRMNLYDNGCDMVKELVGNEEDISRFDFILTASSDEVSSERINSLQTFGDKRHKPGHHYTSDLCNKLVLWAWSRKANNVIWKHDIEKLILDYSIEMSKRYTPNFPLVLGSTIRLKLARLSIALAARLFSTYEDNGRDIYVTENHVTYIFEFLNRIYNKPSFGYGEYSDYFKAGETKTTDSKLDVFTDIARYAYDMKDFILNMLMNARIDALDIRDFLRCTRDQSDLLRSKLVSNGFLIKKAGFYVKSSLFRRALKDELRDIEVKENEKDK